MNAYFPPAPSDPFSQYGYMQSASPEARRQQIQNQFAQSILGQPATDAAQGVGQLAAGISLGLSNYKKNGQAFPTAPGGGSPSFGTALANFFTGRNNGGLY